MLRECAVCNKVYGCHHENDTFTCDYCDLPCPYDKTPGSPHTVPVSHGMCETCFRRRSKQFPDAPISWSRS